MLIGVRAHDFGSGTFDEFEEIIEKIAGLGFNSVQLAPAKSITEIGNIEDLTTEQVVKIREILERHNITVSVLGCYLDFTSELPVVRKESIATFKKYIDFAKVLNANMIATEASYGNYYGENSKVEYSYLMDCFHEIVPYAENAGVLVAIEPVVRHALDTPEITRAFLDHFRSDYLKVLYDQSNLLEADMGDEDDSMFARSIHSFGADIVAVHLKNFVIEDNRQIMCGLTDGIVDLKRIIQWVSQNRPEAVFLREDPNGADIEADLTFIKSNVI